MASVAKALRQTVHRLVAGRRVEVTVEHAQHRSTPRLTAEQRKGNYSRQRDGAQLTVRQQRQLRRMARRDQAAS